MVDKRAPVKPNVKAIAGLKAEDKKYEVSVRDHAGLVIWVYPSGKISYVVRSRIQGKLYRKDLRCDSLSKARAAWAEMRKRIEEYKLDPEVPNPFLVDARATEAIRKAISLEDLANLYIEKHAKPNKKTWLADRQMLDKHVVPLWRGRRAKSIKRPDAIQLVENVAEYAPRQAGKIASLLSKMFNFAMDKGLVDQNPAIRIPKPKTESRDRFLSPEEIKTFWVSFLDGSSSSRLRSIHNALKVQLLTGKRISSVLDMTENQIDRKKMEWLSSGEDEKNGKAHVVPLTTSVIEILDSQNAIDGFFFPSVKQGVPLRADSIAEPLRDQLKKVGCLPFRSHDLRRTCATHLSRLGADADLISKILNHADHSVTAIYNRYDRIEERRNILEAWDRELSQIVHESGGVES